MNQILYYEVNGSGVIAAEGHYDVRVTHSRFDVLVVRLLHKAVVLLQDTLHCSPSLRTVSQYYIDRVKHQLRHKESDREIFKERERCLTASGKPHIIISENEDLQIH